NGAGQLESQAFRLTTLAYDKVGNVLAVKTGMSDVTAKHPLVTCYVYDKLNRREKVYENWQSGFFLDTYGRLTVNRYDGRGNLRSVQSGQSVNLEPHVSVSSFVYDALDRTIDTYAGWNTPQQVHTHQDFDAANNRLRLTTGIGDGPGAPWGYDHAATNA